MYYKAKRKKRKGKNHIGGINPLKLKISFNNRRVTKHGGYALLEGFFKWIGLDRLLAQVKLRRRERSYRVKDLLRILLDIILLGVERVSNVALLSKDALLAGLRDLPRLPDDSTLFRFLQSFSAAEVEQLEEVTRKLMKKYSKIKGAVEVTLDFDSTLIPLSMGSRRAPLSVIIDISRYVPAIIPSWLLWPRPESCSRLSWSRAMSGLPRAF